MSILLFGLARSDPLTPGRACCRHRDCRRIARPAGECGACSLRCRQTRTSGPRQSHPKEGAAHEVAFVYAKVSQGLYYLTLRCSFV
jgi:hypothetical protein